MSDVEAHLHFIARWASVRLARWWSGIDSLRRVAPRNAAMCKSARSDLGSLEASDEPAIVLQPWDSHIHTTVANNRRGPNVGLMVGNSLRRWPNIKPTSSRRLLLTGSSLPQIIDSVFYVSSMSTLATVFQPSPGQTCDAQIDPREGSTLQNVDLPKT